MCCLFENLSLAEYVVSRILLVQNQSLAESACCRICLLQNLHPTELVPWHPVFLLQVDAKVSELPACFVTGAFYLLLCVFANCCPSYAILKHLGPSSSDPPPAHNYVNPQDIPSGNRQKPFKFQPDGKPICMRCNRAGHIARFCRVDIGGLPGGVGSRGQGPKGGVQVNAVEQQGN